MDALDALALALTAYEHVWTERERQLYEDAVAHLAARQAIVGALVRRLQRSIDLLCL
jgi:hypothetical protein